ncbi:MAG TPA: 3-isopropylmalate dehydratase small subunit [Jatrophihabitans sp.]|jgi:3-isopropylmalate/(R)-2-methylmalate dehydratase small subunit|uniref:3-isopropylmalate dehydratase small subunit n=1 Tax=Jatrophihabitans sp. TaxID=1932789 RepID=UPI002EED07BB
MIQFSVHTGTAVPLRRSDVDTDQIIPARFCTNTARAGFADGLFADWRADPAFVLDHPRYRGASVLVAGENFGVGSSREAAVWALRDFGFRAVIAPRFGDIFCENCLMNGLLPVQLPADVVARVWRAVESDPATRITVDLVELEVRVLDVTQPFTFGPDHRERLLRGLDPVDVILRHEIDIAAYEKARRATPLTTDPCRAPT